jgi:hypothetical protein
MARRTAMGNPFDGQIPTVSATASPVDTYVQGVAKRNPFASLAETLNNFKQKAVPALRKEEDRLAKEEFSQGLQLYNETRKNIGEAVKDGDISESDSPFLRKGYRVGNLNVMAARYAADLDRDLEAKKLFHGGDPALVEEYVKKYYDDFKTKNPLDRYTDGEVAQYFSEPALKANEAFRASWLEKHREHANEQIYIQKSDEINAYTAIVYDGADTPEEIEVAHFKMKTWLELKTKEWESDGLKKDKLNKLLIDSVITTALEERSLEVIDLLNQIKLGTGSLGSTAYARAKAMQAESSIASIISAEETKEAKVRKFKIDTLRAKAVTKANVGIISYFNNGLKETDRLAFEESLSELTQLGLGGDEKAGKLVKVITEFYQSEQQRYEEDVDELKEFDPAELASAYELMASARTESEVFKILTVLTDSDGQKLNKSEVKQLLTYGLTNAGAGQEKFDLTDSTSSARMFLGQLEDLYPRPKPEEWDSQEAYYKVTQANAWTRSILSRDFQNRYLRMYKEKKDSLGGAEPTDEDKFQISKTIYTQMSQIYISNATRAEALKRLQEVVPE